MRSPDKIFLTNMIFEQRLLKLSKINDILDKLFIVFKNNNTDLQAPQITNP